MNRAIKMPLLAAACAMLALSLACASAPAAVVPAEATPAATAVANAGTASPRPAADGTAAPVAAPSPSPETTPLAQIPTYDPMRLPGYAEEFLGESLDDYRRLLAAIAAGETSVILSDAADYGRIERTVHALYPQKMLLYDARYTLGEGPFSFDASTHTVSIRYLYDAGTHRMLMQAFADRMAEALGRCTPGMSQRDCAEALYLFVVENLHYELDMRLTVYDAVTNGAAFCQTYAALYQLLLTQVGIESYLVGGGADTDGDGTADAEHQWNRLLLDGAWYYADPTWDRGDLHYFAMSYETCVGTGHVPPFLDPCDALLDVA